jgi:MFS family permease
VVVVTVAGGSLLLAAAADLIGRRRFYRLGMLLFALASLLGALAPNATC